MPSDIAERPLPNAVTVTTSDALPPELHRPAKDPSYDAIIIESEFAGVIYLINLALHLELYADFTRPAMPGIALPPGDLLALIGEHACGRAFRDDPVWGWLGNLAGRHDGEHPGHGFDARELDTLVAALATSMETSAARALGLERGHALPHLCRRAGRLALSPTRVDAFFALVAHPLDIRLAGLDRNPGWVPAAGRIIELHYE